ncbi:hypothetical protein FQN54_004699 [Arachnomyces sp. PD_36]|nr:hypothetical protein FQN54_004699 [Arachnomyces sp. PD_36]
MKVFGILGIAFISGSLAASAPSSRQKCKSRDAPLELAEGVVPTRTVELHKLCRTGERTNLGTMGIRGKVQEGNDSYGCGAPVPADFLGLDSDIIGGYTKNGSGTPPEWRSENGGWVHICDYEYDWQDDEYYFGGSEVPFPAGEESPNGLVPSLTELPFPESDEPPYWSNPCRDRADPTYECSMRNTSYCYPYPYRYDYTESSRTYDYDIDGYEYDNTTTTIDILCCCTDKMPCGCDNAGGKSLVQAIGDHFAGFDDWGEAKLENSTSACYMRIDDSDTLVVNGSLTVGSTKANSTLPDFPGITHTSVCYGGSTGLLLRDLSSWLFALVAFQIVWLSL